MGIIGAIVWLIRTTSILTELPWPAEYVEVLDGMTGATVWEYDFPDWYGVAANATRQLLV